MQTNPTDTIHQVIARLHDEAIKAVAMPPRDQREPGRRRKQIAEAKLKAVIDRMFNTQKARLEAWLRLQRAFDAGAKLPPGWNEIPDKVMNELVINLIESRQDGIRLFDEQVQTGIDYTATNARAAKRAREYAGTLVKGIDGTTEDAVRNIIAAFAETPGMTIGDVMAQLPFDEQRARMIAVTEVTRAYADGELEAGIELRKKYPDVSVVKTWFTNNDEKVCPICEPLDGSQIDFEDGWSTGGEGDPEGLQGPPAHPNCRCWMQTRTKITKSIKYDPDQPRDEQGRWSETGGGGDYYQEHGVGIDGTGDATIAGTWGVSVTSSREELENAGYIAIYRGTNKEGIEQIRSSSSGVMGEGVYFYTDPNAAASYSEKGGGIVTAYVQEFDASHISDVPGRNYRLVVVKNKGAIIRRGIIKNEDIGDKSLLSQKANDALDTIWSGYD